MVIPERFIPYVAKGFGRFAPVDDQDFEHEHLMRKKKPDRILRTDVQQLIKKWQLGQTLTFTARGVLSPQSPCRPPPLSADFRSLMECSPSPSSQDPFDVVTLIDVIEHMPIRSTCCGGSRA